MCTCTLAHERARARAHARTHARENARTRARKRTSTQTHTHTFAHERATTHMHTSHRPTRSSGHTHRHSHKRADEHTQTSHLDAGMRCSGSTTAVTTAYRQHRLPYRHCRMASVMATLAHSLNQARARTRTQGENARAAHPHTRELINDVAFVAGTFKLERSCAHEIECNCRRPAIPARTQAIPARTF